jgi:hypothetical protein
MPATTAGSWSWDNHKKFEKTIASYRFEPERIGSTRGLPRVGTRAYHPPMPARRSRLLSCLLCALVLCGGFVVTHGQADQAATLAIAGDVPHALTLSATELQTLPRATVTFTDHGTTTKYDGVLVSELLKRAGVPLGAELRGPALATYVLASAKDGYQVVFSLGELDADLSGSRIIVADRADDKPLDDEHGPFRIVVAQDTRGARSIRMLQRLDVVRLRK